MRSIQQAKTLDELTSEKERERMKRKMCLNNAYDDDDDGAVVVAACAAAVDRYTQSDDFFKLLVC